MKRLLLVLGVVLATSGPTFAGGHHGCCADCGCNTGLRKVCRWVCEEVEVKVPGWDCECADISIPGKSPYCIKEECDCDCCEDGCHNCVAHLGGHLNHKKEWGAPCGCCVKTVKLLVRTEKTVKKKVWKPVIETVCANCCNNCTGGGCADGNCAAGAPGIDAVPYGAPTVAPQDDSTAPMPPMPPPPAGQQTSRRSTNPLLSAFVPASPKR